MTSSNKKIIGNKGEEARTPVEAPNTLRSIAHARIIDLVSEGEIVGLVDGLKSIYLNETPIENADGTFNFKNYTVDYRYGTQTQDYIEGFPGVENELLVGVELKASTPYTRQFTNTDVNALRVRLSTPALFKVNTENGDTRGYNVSYAIDIATDDGPWVEVLTSAFSGKTTTKYERAHRIELPTATDNWQLRVRRITADSTDTNIQDTTVVEAVTEIVDGKLRYPNSAIFGLTFDASQFQSIPSRSYDIKGRIVRVPTNYDPDTREYTGVWDGTFKLAWTDNPAWCFLDIATHERYGLGHLLDDSHINKWSLYKIAQYCDELVPDGKGGMEPRFTCNLFLQGQADAYKVLQDMSSIFRGMSYWANGEICAVGDMPGDVAYVYTPANVVGGKFEYQSSARKTRHTVALVSWNDMSDFGRSKIEYVDDAQGINRYGIQQTDVIAIGCSSQSMAQRQGRYILATSRHETNTVNFSVGLDGVIAVPGMIIGIADPNRAGARMGGRINTMSVDGTSVILDAMPSAGLIAGDTLTVVMPDGVSATRTIASVNDAERTVVVSPGFDAQATPEAVWVAEKSDLNAQKFRVVAVAENGDMTFTITALQYEEDKYDAADLNTKIDPEVIALPPIKSATQVAPTNVTITAHEIAGQVVAMTNLTVSWDAAVGAVRYEAQLSQDNGEWIKLPVNGLNATMQNILPGTYRARVAAINTTGVYSAFTASSELVVADQTTVPGVVGDIQTDVGVIQDDVAANAQAIIDEANARAAEMAAVAQDILDEATLRASEDVRIAQEAADDAAAQVTAAKAILEAADVAEAQERADEDIRIAQEAADDAAAQVAAAKAILDQAIADEIADRTAQDAINAQAITDEATLRASEDARIASEAATDATTKVNNAKSELEAEVAVVRSQVADIYGADEYDSGESYPVDDLVQSGGKLYRALQAVPVGEVPDPAVSTAYWELLGNYKSLGDAVAANLSQTTTNTNSISAHSATLTDHTTRLGAAESSITTLEEAYADGDEALAGRITALESTVDDPVTGVDATASGLSALTTRVTATEEGITSQSERTDALSSSIDTRLGDITTDAGAPVFRQATQPAITGVRRNLLSATDTFAQGAGNSGWRNYWEGATRETGRLAPDGSMTAVRLTAVTSGAHPTTSGLMYQNGAAPLVAGQTVTLSIWMRADSPLNMSFGRGDGGESHVVSVDTEWREFSIETVVADNQLDRYMQIVPSLVANAVWEVWHPQTELGTAATPYQAVRTATDFDGSGLPVGSEWVNTADGNKRKRYNGATWDSVDDTRVAANATAIDSLETLTTQQGSDITAVTNRTTALESTVNDAETGVDATATGLSNLTTRVTTAEGDISTISSDVTALTTRVTDAETDITANGSAISGLDTRLDTAEGNISSQASDITALESTVNNPTTGVNATASGLSSLTTRVTTAENNITSVSSDVAALQNTVNDPVTGVDVTASGLSALTTRVSTAEGTISSHSSDITTLEGRVTSTEGDISAQGTAINGLDTRLDSAEGTITSQGSAITALQNTVNNPTTGVVANASGLSALTTRVTATEEGITSQSERTDVLDTAVRAVMAAGDNWIPNPTFKPTGYDMGASYDSLASTDPSVPAGAPAPYVARLDGARDYWPQNLAYTPVNEGDVFDCTIWVAFGGGTIGGSTGDGSFNVYVYGATGPNGESKTALKLTGSVSTTTPGWVKFTGRLTITAGRPYILPFLQVNHYTNLGSTVVWYATNWQFRRVTEVAANATAIDSLETLTTQQGSDITAVTNRTTALESTVNDPVTGVDVTASGLSSLKTRVTTAEGTISTHTSDITSLETRVTDTEGDISGHTTAISGLDTRLDTAEGNITNQASDITALETTVNHPSTGVAATASGLSALTTRVSTAEGTISSHTSDITALENTVNNPTTGVTATASGLSALTTRVTDTEGDISTISSDVTALEGRMTTAEGNITTQGSAIGSLDTRLDTAEGTITSQGSAITSLENTVNNATTGVNATASGLSALTTRVTTNEGDIDTITSDITALENTVNNASTGVNATASGLSALTTRVTTAEGTISAHTTDITDLENTVNNATTGVNATASGLSALTTRVTTAEGTVSTHTSDITSLQNRVTDTEGDISGQATAISGLDARLDTAEGTISSHTSSITSLQNTVNNPTTGVAANASGLSALDTRVDSAEGTISSHTSSINALESTVNNATTGVAATASGLSALTTRVTDTEGDIATNVSSINGINTRLNNATTGLDAKASITTTNTITGRLDNTGGGRSIEQVATALATAEVNIGNNSASLAGKASATDLTNLTGRVDTAEGTLTLHGTRLSKIEVSTSDMPVNYVRKGMFGSDMDKGMWDNGSVFATTAHSSGYCLRTTTGGYEQNALPAHDGDQFDVNIEVYTAEMPTGAYLLFGLHTIHGDGTNGFPQLAFTDLSGGFHKVTGRITLGTNVQFARPFFFMVNSDGVAPAYFQNYRIERVSNTVIATANGLAATDATVAQHGLDIVANANSINSVSAALTGGGNLLPNSEFVTTEGWYASNTTGLPCTPIVHNGDLSDGNLYIPQGTSAILMHVPGTPAAGTFVDLYTDKITVDNLQKYIAAVRFNSFRCKAYMYIQYQDAAGSWIETADTIVDFAATNLFAPNGPTLAQMPKIETTYPDLGTNVTTARVVLRLVATGDANPYLWWIQPQFEQATAGQTKASPYSIGTAGKASASVVEAMDVRVSTQEKRGNGVNLLTNSTFAANLDGWTDAYGSGWSASTRDLAGDSWRPANIHNFGFTHPGTSSGVAYRQQLIPIEPGKRYGFSAYAASHRAKAYVEISYLRSDQATSDGYFGSAALDAAGGATILAGEGLDSWDRLSAMATTVAPTTTRYALVRMVAWGDGVSTNGYTWFCRPMLEVLADEQTEPSNWNVGGNETFAEYSLALDVNGKVVGLYARNDGEIGNLILNFDNVIMESSDGNSTVSGGVIVNRAGGYMLVTGPGIGASSDIIQWFGPNMDVDLISKTNAITYKDITGEDYRPTPPATAPITFNANSASTTAPLTLQLVNNNTAGAAKAVTATYYFKGVTVTASSTPYGSGSATLSLWRQVGAGAFAQLGATQNVTLTDTVEPGPGGKWQHTMEGSVTLNVSDTDTSLSNHTYEWRLTARSSSVTVTNQTLTLKTVEG